MARERVMKSDKQIARELSCRLRGGHERAQGYRRGVGWWSKEPTCTKDTFKHAQHWHFAHYVSGCLSCEIRTITCQYCKATRQVRHGVRYSSIIAVNSHDPDERAYINGDVVDWIEEKP